MEKINEETASGTSSAETTENIFDATVNGGNTENGGTTENGGNTENGGTTENGGNTENGEVETTIANGIYVGVNATELDYYLAVYRQGDKMEKSGVMTKIIVLGMIEHKKLYTSYNNRTYKSTAELATSIFDIKRDSVYQYLRVAENFINLDAIDAYVTTNGIQSLVNGNFDFSTVKSILADSSGKDFTPTNLLSIRSVDVNTVKDLMARGELTYDMTDKQIRAAVEPYRKRKAKKNGGNTENDTAELETNTAKIETTTAELDNGGTTTEMALETIKHYQHANETLTKQHEDDLVEKMRQATEIETLRAQIAKLQKENEELAAENQRLIDNAAEQTFTIKTQQATIDAVNVDNKNLQAENVTLRNSNNSYKAANAKAKNTIDKLRNENEVMFAYLI